MTELPPALAPMAEYRQFILWRPELLDNGKTTKKPLDYRTGYPGSVMDTEIHLSFAEAVEHASKNPDHQIGFVFTEADPFFFLDIDGCAENGAWSPLSLQLLQRLPGAAVEVSQSGKGFHIFGVGAIPQGHECKNTELGLELYTSKRFVALTGRDTQGSILTDCSAPLMTVVRDYFQRDDSRVAMAWTSEPDPAWQGHEDDTVLIEAACASKSDRAIFGLACSFKQIWEADDDALASAYPGDEVRLYDSSSVDAALAQHLAFWTGNNCERMLTLMWASGLVRAKWEREDYLQRTILHAVSLCKKFHISATAPVVDPIAEANGASELKAKSDKQRLYAERVRATKLLECAGDPTLISLLCSIGEARVFLDHKDETPEQIAAWSTPVTAPAPDAPVGGPVMREAGLQFLTATEQLKYFAGCAYVQNQHKIFHPSSGLLNPDRFNATFGGYEFQMSDGGKSKDKAWTAFTESQLVDFPMANSTCFRPEIPTGTLVREEGWTLVNTYIPIDTPRAVGDPTPFLNHVEKMLPNKSDRDIIYAYMASMEQHKGFKFQWCPLIQGVEGNGKTLISECMSFVLGKRYTHWAKASDIDNKFNGWLANKLVICVEDIYLPDHKREVVENLKPMITGWSQEIQSKGVDQVTCDVRANFILNSNHKDAIRKTRNDRRFAVFYTAQQEESDLERDGMGGSYFPDLYRWCRGGGFAMVSEWLHNYEIPDELNPAIGCHRAPKTTSTEEAVTASLGSAEHEILEAIAEEREGFCGGWVSSIAVEHLLKDMRLDRAIPRNKRRAMMESLNYIWHPGLHNGRVNNPTQTDKSKTCLFIPKGHINGNIQSAAAITQAYDNAQLQGNIARYDTKGVAR